MITSFLPPPPKNNIHSQVAEGSSNIIYPEHIDFWGQNALQQAFNKNIGYKILMANLSLQHFITSIINLSQDHKQRG